MTAACAIEWITIPAPDLETARNFYATVFGFTLSEFSPTFVTFKAANLSGALDQDLRVQTPGIGFSITVPDMATTIRANGGEITREPYSLGPNAGFCARFRDPNGNVLELYSERLT